MKHPPKGEVVLCFPGAQQWELWNSDGSGGLRHESSAKAESGDPSSFRNVTHHAFPVSAVTCSPFWAASEDDSLLPDLVEMRLETQGIRPDSGSGRHYDFWRLDRDENRSLLQTIVLPDNRPLALPRGDIETFDISPNFFPLPRNHLVLWKELGKWVTVATRNGRAVYFQGLTASEIDEDAVLELKCFLIQLHSLGLIEELAGVVIWGDLLPEASCREIENELDLSVLSEERPSPLLPEEPLDLLPKQVAEEREIASRRQKIRNWATAAACLYLLVAASFVVLYFMQKRHANTLQGEVARLQQEVGWIGPAAERWNRLEDAWNIERYPLDLMLRIIADLPETGVGLTDIDITTDRILLKGEGSNISLVRAFLSSLKRSALLEDYEWEGPPPKMDQTGITTFEITGKYRYGSA